MLLKIKRFLHDLRPVDEVELDSSLAIVALLCEVSFADKKNSENEDIAIIHMLEKLLDVDSMQACKLLDIGMKEIAQSNSVFDFTSQLKHVGNNMRIKIITAMWKVAYADGHLDVMEEALIRKVAPLIYVTHSEFIRTKLSVAP